MAKKKQKIKRPAQKKKSQPKKPDIVRQGSASKKPLESVKPDFEETLQHLSNSQVEPAADTDEKVERRGGPRPGAGRPRGVTDKFAEVNRLPEKANLTLIPVLQIPFALWSKAIGVKQMALNKDEAKELALPVTQLLEFYFPGRIPEIAWVWLCMLGTTYRIMEPRLERLAQLRKNKVSVPAGEGPEPVIDPGRSKSGQAEPAKGYPKSNE